MKKIFFQIAFICLSPFVFAQVGINTSNPDQSAILDIDSNEKGVLLPRLTSAERDAILNPANGLIIYNTDSDEIQINTNTSATPNWEALSITATSTASPGQSTKYSNVDITTNINNNTAIHLPVFGLAEWNDNTSLYVIDNVNHTVTVNETGRYEILVNASIISTSTSARKAPEMYISVNGTQVGSFSSTGYMRRANGHEETTLNLNEVIQVNAGDVISIDILRAGNTGAVNLRSSGSTNFYIEKIL